MRLIWSSPDEAHMMDAARKFLFKKLLSRYVVFHCMRLLEVQLMFQDFPTLVSFVEVIM